VADEQQTPIGSQAGQLRKRPASVEVAGQRWMHRQQATLLRAPVLGGQLGGLARTCLGTEQDGVKAHLQTLQRDPRRARLAFTALGQTALGVHARAVRLSVSVT
jgi:hypothetical protein